MDEKTEIVVIKETDNYAQSVLNGCLLDIAKIEKFAKDKAITYLVKDKDGKVLKDKDGNKVTKNLIAQSETLTNMETLSTGLKDKTIKYAFDKKRYNKANRSIQNHYKNSKATI